MVAQPTRNTPFGNLIVTHAMDQPWISRGVDPRGPPAQDGAAQAPVVGTHGDGAAHGLPHLPQLQWQQRARGQNFPVNTYAMPEAMLPPPVPPGMPEPGYYAAQNFNMGTPNLNGTQVPPPIASAIPVPLSTYGDSVAPDIESGTPQAQQPQAAWMGGAYAFSDATARLGRRHADSHHAVHGSVAAAAHGGESAHPRPDEADDAGQGQGAREDR